MSSSSSTTEAEAPTPTVVVVDVGHGNCTIVRSAGYSLLVDVPDDPAVYFTIEQLGITRFDFIVISHRDSDHVAGLPTVLANQSISFGRIFVPADPTKDLSSRSTKQLLAALTDAKRSGRASVSRDLDDAYEAPLGGGGLEIDVLAPVFEEAMAGPGGRGVRGRIITSNRASAVLRVALPDGASVLLPGDADDTVFDLLRERSVDLSADVLVFPHHGSDSTVSDQRRFAAELCQEVQPQVVLFSVARGVHARPSPDVIAGVREARPSSYIACTQLCTECATDPLDESRANDHLTDLPASGRRDRRCCAGTVVVSLADGGLVAPDMAAHQDFITANAPTAMCRAELTLQFDESS